MERLALSIPWTALLLILMVPIVAIAYEVVPKDKVANLRDKPDGKLLAKMPAGAKMRVISKNSATKDLSKLWFKVETEKGQVGWVAARVVNLVPPASTQMMPSDTPESMKQYEIGGGAGGEPPAAAAPTDTEAPAGEAAAPTESAPVDEIPDIEILDTTDQQ